MRSYTTTALLLLAVLVGLTPQAFAQAPVPGSCTLGTAEKDLDVNNVLARMFITGSLFYGNTTTDGLGYLVPQAAGNLSPIFAQGIWIGGLADGELRVAGARYDRFEFYPGPLNDDGTLPDPVNCSGANGIEFDRIWKVSRLDIQNYEATGSPSADLGSWPVELGAPVLAAVGNGFDDDGDGVTDEGSDGVSNDDDNGDGIICSGNTTDPCPDGVAADFVDERDEQERVSPELRQAAGRPAYDLAGGDRPELIGDQAVWWVMNDLGNTHNFSLTPPIGVEVQVLAWSFARADALNDVTFYRYRVTKKTPGPLEEAYLTIFSDPDLGASGDDYVGTDTTLSLGYVYNAAPVDANYGIPPAIGYDFFQGPIVDLDGDGESTDTLGATAVNYFINGGPAGTEDAVDGVEIYNYQQGLWGNGTPVTANGNGYQTSGPVTKFVFAGDPGSGEYWSEVNIDGSGGDNPSGDRRLLVSTGPFTMEPGVPQDIVFGVVFGQGIDRFDSIDVLRSADRLAQTAYNIDFELASAPPPPPLCDPNSSNPELLPGSGNCLEAVEVDGQAALVWGYPTNSPNYLGQYETADFLLAGQGAPDSTYNFEGFNIYRYATSSFDDTNRELVATFDVVNGVTTVVDTTFSPEVGGLIPFLVPATRLADDTGVQYSYEPTGLTNYTDYYFGVSAYAFSGFSVPMVIESATSKITLRPSNVAASNGGSVQQANLGDRIRSLADQSVGGADVFAQVVDPTAVTGSTYTVEVITFLPDGAFTEADADTTFRVLRDGEEVFNGVTRYRETGVVVEIGSNGFTEQNIVIDGLSFFTFDYPEVLEEDDFAADETILNARFAGGATTAFGIVEVSTAGGVDPCEGVPTDPEAEGYDPGCDLYGGNTVYQDPNRTGEYLVRSKSGSATTLIESGIIYGDDFEMRFTEACSQFGSCLGAYIRDDDEIVSVPFELWNVRDVRNPDDDVRMIPLIRAEGDPLVNWEDTFTSSYTYTSEEDTLMLGLTDPVFFMMPDRPDGYAQFAAAANGFGGPGAIYDREADGDTLVNVKATGGPCAQQEYYIDFCYRSDTPYRSPVGGSGSAGLQVADFAMDGTTPDAGTTILFRTAPKPAVFNGNRFTFDTASLAFQTNNAGAAAEALDLIGIVPNPYLGVSAYETDNLDRVVRFINLPEQATIRIYSVAGTLIRTLRKDGPSRSLDWDLNTHNNLPVASGMYLIHVDVPGVGEKVLKFGVVNRKNRITIF